MIKIIVSAIIMLMLVNLSFGNENINSFNKFEKNIDAKIDSLKIIKNELNKKIISLDSLIESLKEDKLTRQLEEKKYNQIVIKTGIYSHGRDEPNALGKIICKIPSGKELIAYKYFLEGFWKVIYKGKIAYVPDIFIEKNKRTKKVKQLAKLRNEKRKKTIQSIKDYKNDIESEKEYISVNLANIRKSSSTDSKILNKLNYGDLVFIQDRQGDWEKIKFDGPKESIIDSLGGKQELNNKYKEGWIYNTLTSAKLKKAKDKILYSQTEKRPTSKSQKNTYRKKRSDELEALYDSGLLQKLNIDYNEAWVNPTIWYALDYETKLGICVYLAKKCDESGSTGRITFYNNKSGEKLARYSQSWGYKKY